MLRFCRLKEGPKAAYLLGWVAFAIAFGGAAFPARGQPPAAPRSAAPELLNSERIEQQFGSYGVEVLRSDARLRVANLYSATSPANGEQKPRTCRTFAVTRYPEVVASEFAAEHEQILGGGSIGAVFASHGWRVTKTHLYYGEVDAAPRIAELMHVAPGTRLALDAYVLVVTKAGASREYAAIVEIHHPDYLRSTDLAAIYGPPDARGREPLLAELLADAQAAAR